LSLLHVCARPLCMAAVACGPDVKRRSPPLVARERRGYSVEQKAQHLERRPREKSEPLPGRSRRQQSQRDQRPNREPLFDLDPDRLRGHSPPRAPPAIRAPEAPQRSLPSRRPPVGVGNGKMPEAVIFLDIDGVVHSLYGQDLFRESCLVLLEKIVRGTGASIVLSSTWRTQARARETVNVVLKQRRLAAFIDVTRDLSAEMHRHVPREVEICEWVDRHPEVERWIAIDDIDLQCDKTECAHRLRGHFVHTSSACGLVPGDADLALRLMAAQLRSETADRRPASSFPERPVSAPRRRPGAVAEKTSDRSGQAVPGAAAEARIDRHAARRPGDGGRERHKNGHSSRELR